MFTTTSSFRRIAAIAGATTITCISAITTTYAAQPTPAITEPPPQRQCFIAQPRWNTAIDGPPPTCPTPSWQQASGFRWGTPGSSAGIAPRRTGPGSAEEPDVATMADCVDPGHRPVVKTCPYPIKSGDRFSSYMNGEAG